jgi:hypothetical protein
MDRISRSLLKEFSEASGIGSLAEDSRFEHFAAFIAVSRHYGQAFDAGDVVTGSGGDTGIDAIAIIVNGSLITDVEEIENLQNTNGFIDAHFLFVQAERSPSFSTSKIGQFSSGVQDFFSDRPQLPRNTAIKRCAEIMDKVYNLSGSFKRGNPACSLYYVTTGRWGADASLEARRTAETRHLQQLNIFRQVEFVPIGADQLQKMYADTKNAISRTFSFVSKTVMPEIPGVKEAYLGLLPAVDFVKLLDDGNGNIMRGIFYDNVRDFQDYNPVNTEIMNTIQSDQERVRFSLLNNGVTVIAKTLRATGNKFHIEDYQVVNGCQTSHVLFDCKSSLDDSVMVPLRLIATEDEKIISSIVRATNKQTEVKDEQLLALSDFQKKIEVYFETFSGERSLYYERRSRQYSSNSVIEKARIITPANLIRAYASIFRQEPHRTTRSYRLLLEQLGQAIFGADDMCEPYYYAGFAYYRLDSMFRRGFLDAKFKPARYHVLMAARMLANSGYPPKANSHDMIRYCNDMFDALWDPHKGQDLLLRAATIVDKVAAGNFGRDHIRTEPFTQALITEVKRIASP